MMEAFEILLTASFWVAAIRIASPLIFATMGELVCERAGVLNLGIEGIMTAGAFAGWFTVYLGFGLWTGVLVAALTGAAFGLLHGFLTVPLGLSQHVTGIGITDLTVEPGDTGKSSPSTFTMASPAGAPVSRTKSAKSDSFLPSSRLLSLASRWALLTMATTRMPCFWNSFATSMGTMLHPLDDTTKAESCSEQLKFLRMRAAKP